jgi:hypothetical protein
LHPTRQIFFFAAGHLSQLRRMQHAACCLLIQRPCAPVCARVSCMQVFRHMQQNRVQPDAWVCSSFLGALERGGQWLLAERFFLQMCHATHHPLARYEEVRILFMV